VNKNVIKKEAVKIPKYKDPTIGIQCTWNVKARVLPAVIGQLEPSPNCYNNI
jgi:hypothetical protein